MTKADPMIQPLDDALRAVQAACKRAYKPDRLADWLDFLQERDNARFLGQGPEHLTARDFDHYLSECGSRRPEPEVAWFLPRMCAIMASGKPLRLNLGWIDSFAFLGMSGFPEAWSPARAQAMQAFCEVLVADFVADPERYDASAEVGGLTLGTMLCAVTRQGVEPAGVLEAVDRLPPELVRRSMADWAVQSWRDPASGKLDLFSDVYWEQNPATDQVRVWFERHGVS